MKTLITTLRIMISGKVRFLKNVAFVCVGVALGAKDVVWFIIGLAAAIVLDALLTVISLPDTPRPTPDSFYSSENLERLKKSISRFDNGDGE